MSNTCCCNDKVYTSNVYYDGAYLPITQITSEDDGNTILQKIENVLSNTGNFNIVPGLGITITKIGSTYNIVNSAPNVNQSITLAGNVLTLSNGGGSVTIPNAPQTLAWDLGTSQLTISGGNTVTLPTIPPAQTLSWDSGTSQLSISNGNTVTITGTTYTAGSGISIVGNVITNTSPNVVQTVSILGNTLSLSGGGGSVTIPTADGSETKVQGGSNVTVTGSGTVGSPYIVSSVDTVYSPSLTLVGNDLSINGGNTVTLPIPPTPDGSETKIVAGANATVTGSGTTASPYVVSAASGLQTLSIVGDSLSISSGNTITLPTPDGSETKVTAGTGINVTGSGTTAAPYIVTSTVTNELENNSYSYRRAVSGNGFDTKGGLATGSTQYINTTGSTINSQSHFVVVDNSSDAIDVVMPDPASFANRIIWIKAITTVNAVTFSAYVPKNGSTDISDMAQRYTLVVKSSFNGSSWVWESMLLS